MPDKHCLSDKHITPAPKKLNKLRTHTHTKYIFKKNFLNLPRLGAQAITPKKCVGKHKHLHILSTQLRFAEQSKSDLHHCAHHSTT